MGSKKKKAGKTAHSETTVDTRRDKLLGCIIAHDDAGASMLVAAEDVKLVDPTSGETLLHMAIRADLPLLVEALLSKGADPFIEDDYKKTPFILIYDSETPNLEDSKIGILKSILDNQAIRKELADYVFSLIKNNDNDAIILLEIIGEELFKEISANHTFLDNNTALHQAVHHQNNTLIEKLIEFGVDPTIKNSNKQSPIDLARQTGNPKILSLLTKGMRTAVSGKLLLSKAAPPEEFQVTKAYQEKSASREEGTSFKVVKKLSKKVPEKKAEKLFLENSEKQRQISIPIRDKELSDLSHKIITSEEEGVSTEELDEYYLTFAAKTIALSDSLTELEVSFLLNLISKTDYVNHHFSIPMLNALRDRAVKLIDKFNAQGLAIIYNFISKLNNSSSREWQSLLLKLRQAAFAKADEFNNQGISMIFNCIASLNDCKSSEWQPLIQKLIQCAISVAHQFEPQAIAVIYNLFDKLGDALPGQGIMLIKALEKNTLKTWGEFNDKKKNSASRGRASQKSMREGEFANRNYSDFRDLVKSQLLMIEDMTTLGAVVKFNPAYYFEETEEGIQNAAEFLKTFWTNEDYFKLTVKSHEEKCKKFSRSEKIQSFHSSCISFVTVMIKDAAFCFISVSGFIDNQISEALSNFISSYNQGREIRYILMQHNPRDSDFNNLMQEITEDKKYNKACAEKNYTKCLTKLLLKHGEAMEVKNIVNCSFYPHQKIAPAENKLVKPILNSSKTVVAGNFIIKCLPCCPQCMKDKPAILSTLKTAQLCGTSPNQRLELSPIRFASESFINFSDVNKKAPADGTKGVTPPPAATWKGPGVKQ